MTSDCHRVHRVAVVLARGGSKRIKEKNLQKIGGIPLAVMATDVGVKAGLPTYISSDDEKILNLKYSPAVQIVKRSTDTARDDSSSEAAVLELANKFAWDDETEIVLLPPTSPLRTEKDVLDFLFQWSNELEPLGYNQAMSVLATKQDLWRLSDQSVVRVRNLISKQNESRRSQEREPLYIETSAIYLSKLGILKDGKGFTDGKLALIPISKIASLDIDEYEDLSLARKIYESK